VFLRSLILKGFKSFADATALTFEPGVTVVVGPNGSGKSNVVDAIAWVLGAQAPSAVRSTKMDDVIFAGTAKRPALGRAEVSLTIDNTAGLLSIEFSEVTLSRTLFRTGESEYAINGVPCRLLDVQELLSDSGVGRQQHVIVGQGQIDAVLNARPEERRAIVEEAAGVLKYRKRKEKAERRLEATEASLLRVQDLLREVRRQLRPLERQAEAARRHDALDRELRALRIHLAGREIDSLRGRLSTLVAQRVAAAETERELRALLARLDTEVVSAESHLSAVGGSDLGDDLARAEQLRERARGLGAVVAERNRAVASDFEHLADTSVVASLAAEGERLTIEADEVAAEGAELAPERAAVEAAEAALSAERGAFDQEAIDAPGDDATGAAADARGELRTLREAANHAAHEDTRIATRLAQLAELTGAIDETIERHRYECARAEADERQLVDALESAERHRRDAEATLTAALDAQDTARSNVASWSARAEALALALDAARARAGAEQLATVPGVLGTLFDMLEIDSGWEAAFEAAAGDALSAVVVDSAASGRDALATLHGAGVSGAVVPLGLQRGSAVAAGVGEAVRAHVTSPEPAVSALLDRLVGSAVLVDGGWERALDAALAHPEVVIVTRQGDRFGPSGWRVGSGAIGATGAALEEARASEATAAAVLERCEAQLVTARLSVDGARRAEAEQAHRLDDTDAVFAAATDGLARAQAERIRIASEAEALAAARAETAERIARVQRRVNEVEAVLPGLEAEESAAAAFARARQQARSWLEERAIALGARRREIEVALAGVDERAALIARRLGEIDARLQADADARSGAAARRAELARVVWALDSLGALVARCHDEAERQLGELHEQRRRQTEEARAVALQLDALRAERAKAEQSLDGERERSRRVDIEEAEVKLRLEGAVEALRRDHDCEPDVALVAPCPSLPDGIGAPARARELDRELRLLGPINPLALEEFTALQERHTFLEEQLEDVKTSRRELMRVISSIDGEIRQVFAAAYADVKANFEVLFDRLFPGGSGRLPLTDPDDLLTTGIEVEARPSGKNVKKLSLLSGGERSLTALAFLFAVFRSRPSPFYVMDEVEAALDDVNLHRFLGLVDEFRQEAQLIVVSHQKRTMEAADSLVGVTMAPGGSSKVLTERVATIA
jgi:chromosome segregation protein